MKSLIFKSPNGYPYMKITGNLRRGVLDCIETNQFKAETVIMESGKKRIKFTCLVNDIAISVGDIKIYLDKGSVIYNLYE